MRYSIINWILIYHILYLNSCGSQFGSCSSLNIMQHIITNYDCIGWLHNWSYLLTNLNQKREAISKIIRMDAINLIAGYLKLKKSKQLIGTTKKNFILRYGIIEPVLTFKMFWKFVKIDCEWPKLEISFRYLDFYWWSKLICIYKLWLEITARVLKM